MLDSRDCVDPEAIYVLSNGPLKGAYVRILGIEDDGERVRAIVQRGNLLTPPILIESSDLKKIPSAWSLQPWPVRVLAVGLPVSFVLFSITHSAVALVTSLACFAGCLAHFGRITIQDRRLKTCPICCGCLDPNTRSHCEHCGWDRPMPIFLSAELRATEARTTVASTESEPTPEPPQAIRWYVKVYFVLNAGACLAVTVGLPLVPLQIAPQAWQNWALKTMGVIAFAFASWHPCRAALAVVRSEVGTNWLRLCAGKAELYGKGSAMSLTGVIVLIAMVIAMHARILRAIGVGVLLFTFGCYILLTGLCLLLWAGKGATRLANLRDGADDPSGGMSSPRVGQSGPASRSTKSPRL